MSMTGYKEEKHSFLDLEMIEKKTLPSTFTRIRPIFHKWFSSGQLLIVWAVMKLLLLHPSEFARRTVRQGFS